ncbi:serine/threonine-protein kinase UCNL-like [Triticum dicoccoides]|uniref:serine/threonine-protein kinase UCNL-like n=1 Tax=Triticum dicoccoides TaxID=85692 RepID=UPI00188EAA08|nr:serine/threonine-protein kinase UCNL-like [Triticum dicoccoides]
MAFGRTLFKGKNCKETFRNVLHREVEFPCDTQRRMPELTDLISWLLQRDPARRLGYAGGTDKIRVHPFFAGMAWDMLADVTHPPYIPPPAEDNAADGEGFDVRDYFKKLHQSPAPSPPESGSSSSSSSSDFSSVF